MSSTSSATGGPAGAGILAALSADLAGAVEAAARSVVAIHARRRIPSSGIVWRDGVVVAASHTVTRDDDIAVTLPDGSRTRATLVGRDPGTDLVALRLDAGAAGAAGATRVPPIERGDASHLAVGRLVLAVGRPGASATASLGLVSAVGGEWRTWQGGTIDRFVRLDLAIHDGFSGGALVEAGGRVLGLNTSGLARAAAVTIPAGTVDRVLDQLLAGGRVRRGYLGVASQPVRLPDSLRRALGLEQRTGLVVVSVEPDGPADRAGLLLGDVVIGLDGTAVGDPADVLAVLGGDRIGKPLAVRVVRAGAVAELSVTVGER